MKTIELFWSNGKLAYRVWQGDSLVPYKIGYVTNNKQLDILLSIGKITDGYSANEARQLLARSK